MNGQWGGQEVEVFLLFYLPSTPALLVHCHIHFAFCFAFLQVQIFYLVVWKDGSPKGVV